MKYDFTDKFVLTMTAMAMLAILSLAIATATQNLENERFRARCERAGGTPIEHHGSLVCVEHIVIIPISMAGED